jgi:hypothetical protein
VRRLADLVGLRGIQTSFWIPVMNGVPFLARSRIRGFGDGSREFSRPSDPFRSVFSVTAEVMR